jgi:hypothetical protein
MQDGELQTLGVDAQWTISDKWIKAHGEEAFDNVNYAVIEVIKEMHAQETPTGDSIASTSGKSGGGSGAGKFFLWIFVILGIVGGLYWFIFKFNVTSSRA